jgi:hypothetical protein
MINNSILNCIPFFVTVVYISDLLYEVTSSPEVYLTDMMNEVQEPEHKVFILCPALRNFHQIISINIFLKPNV